MKTAILKALHESYLMGDLILGSHFFILIVIFIEFFIYSYIYDPSLE